MANRYSDLDFSVLAALLLVSVVCAKSSKMQPEQHTWLLGHECSSSPVQAAPASSAAAFPASPVPELPAKSASGDSLATDVMRPAVATPPMHTRDVTHARDVLVVNASHANMACISPLGRDSSPYLQYIQHFYGARHIPRFQGVHDIPFPLYPQFVPFIHGK